MNPSQAEVYGQRILELAPDSYQAHYWLAVKCERNHEPARAIGEYQAAIEKAPAAAGLHFALGRVYLQMANYEAAAEAFRQELAIQPRFGAAHLNLGLLHLLRAEFPASLTALAVSHSSALQARAGRTCCWGRVQVRLGNLEQAAAELERAVQLQPDLRSAHYELASVYSRLGRKAEAQKQLRAFRALAETAREPPAKGQMRP